MKLNRALYFSVIAVFGCTIGGCATQQMKIADTTYPEVTIHGVSVADVRNRIIENMMQGGATLDNSNGDQIVVSKELSGFGESVAQLAIGNAYSAPVRARIAYTVLGIDDGVRVFVQMSEYTQMPGGQVNSVAVNDNNDFNEMQRGLNRLRDSMQAQKP